MKRNRPALIAAVLCAAVLSACGNSTEVPDVKGGAQVVKNLVTSGFGLVRKPDTETPNGVPVATVRAALDQSAVPVYGVRLSKIHYIGYMAPYGDNGPIRTWASTDYQTISMIEGVVVATRGFGADIMSAVAPGVGQIKSGTGFFHRVYYYLDGADQPQRVDFDCNFSASGSESINLLGKGYVARKVTETCANPDSQFKNAYWFDGSGNLRQSDQFVSTLLGTMRIQRLVD